MQTTINWTIIKASTDFHHALELIINIISTNSQHNVSSFDIYIIL